MVGDWHGEVLRLWRRLDGSDSAFAFWPWLILSFVAGTFEFAEDWAARWDRRFAVRYESDER